MRILAAFLLSLLVPFGAFAQAQEMSPDELVRKVTAEVLEAVKSDKELAQGDRDKALALAEKKILPHVDFEEAARLAVGRPWASASPEQKKKLTDEFRTLLIRIYSQSLDSYKGQTMRVLPLRAEPGATDVTVRNQYLKPGQQPVVVDYYMHKTPGGWKIYDIVVAGVSLVLTYRSEFEQITRASGIDGLVSRLAEKNRR
ncbi:MAG: phospholipid-binding protein MlaC [Burkholderiales bacterium]